MNQILLNILTSITEQYQPELQESELGQTIKNSQFIVSVGRKWHGLVSLICVYASTAVPLYAQQNQFNGQSVVERGAKLGNYLLVMKVALVLQMPQLVAITPILRTLRTAYF